MAGNLCIFRAACRFLPKGEYGRKPTTQLIEGKTYNSQMNIFNIYIYIYLYIDRERERDDNNNNDNTVGNKMIDF